MKGNLYYLIVEAWLQKILSIMTNLHREIQWSFIPGYNEMLLSFAVQLEAVPLAGYTDTMTKVMRTFLSSDSTLNLFVRILFLKTRPYNIQEVAFVTELVDSLFCFLSFSFSSSAGSYRRWTDRLERSRHPNETAPKKLPATFSDYPFVQGVLVLLRSDMNQVVIKAMELLYHHWDLLREHQKHIFMLELLSPQMILSFFLHWNVHVRQFYDYLLIYWLLQCSVADRKNRIDVYEFLKDFAKRRDDSPG